MHIVQHLLFINHSQSLTIIYFLNVRLELRFHIHGLKIKILFIFTMDWRRAHTSFCIERV